MKIKDYAIATGISIIVFVVGAQFIQPVQEVIDRTVTRNLGLSSPNISSPYVEWGGVTQYKASGSWNTSTSSIVCSIQNPSPATTTIDRFTAYVSSTGLGTQDFFLSTSTTNTTPTSSSTPAILGAISVAGTQDIAFVPGNPTTTNTALYGGGSYPTSDGNSPLTLAPNEYINLQVATATPGTFASYTNGSCHFVGTNLQ